MLVLGATGTIGRATVQALVERGDQVVAFVRPESRQVGFDERVEVRSGDATDTDSLARDGVRGERFNALISCLASRTGAPDDAWAIDHRANLGALGVAQAAGIAHFVLLSAICVQRPVLAFQHAKLAFERALIASGMRYSIVRPTAFFKSLSGQVARVAAGKPFLVFGDGRLTSCTPIADEDLAEYIVACLDNEHCWNRILPIGGPGPAITPREQGAMLAHLAGQPSRYTQVPVRLIDAIIGMLALLGRIAPHFAAKAELARIGRYYATESMLVLHPATGRYDAGATPATGARMLGDYYAQLLRGDAQAERGDHAVF